ncbi:hypothetical protein ACFVVU_15050 [Kitasatospora sp. NPDC057965]|uniref:hypothetical protein n=1 Tax=Kitasatospora sp. NPDC057965 TaxID=3346291 RepID=UPI0036DA6109
MELLWRTRRRKTLVEWPQAVDDRLEDLVRAAIAAGENVSRSQMLAALVASADTAPTALADVIRTYRLLEADAFTHATPDDLPAPRRLGRKRLQS